MQRRIASGWLTAIAVLALACGTLGKGDDPVAARVGGEVITVAELDESIKTKLYDLRSKELKSMVTQRALEAEAQKRGLTTEAMLDAEFAALPPVDDAAVKAFYDQNAAEMGGRPLEAVAPQIRTHLQNEAKRKAFDAIVAKANPTIELERPRVTLRPGGPSRGPANAPVTIVEFSDFQCPFCQRAKPVLDEVEKRHPNDVRIVYRHLPLDGLHPRARASAEAASCAADGDKFWEYHDKLFANTRALGDEDLRKYAAEVGLEPAAFDECVKSRKHASAVEADVQEAKKLGITGTPAFVVNGIVLSGLQTPDALDVVIKEELGSAAGSGS